MTLALLAVVVVVAVLRERALVRRIDCLERRCDDLTERAVAHGQALQDVRAMAASVPPVKRPTRRKR